MNNNKPALVSLGANQREAPSSINLDVRGTVGPDYLGQKTVDVSGHSCDRPGVLSRMPESDPNDPRITRMDTGEELPVLLSSNMRADPCEGVQGSYTQIVEGECARCGYDRLRVSVHTMAGEHHEKCNACGATQNPARGERYRMPKTDEDRARRERESGDKLVELSTRTAYDLEESTGAGPYVSLVESKNVTRIRKDDVTKLFIALLENDNVELSDVYGGFDLLDKIELINELTGNL